MSLLQCRQTRLLPGRWKFPGKARRQKTSQPPKRQVTRLIHSKLLTLPYGKSPGTVKGDQFTMGALLACVFVHLDENVRQIHSQQKRTPLEGFCWL